MRSGRRSRNPGSAVAPTARNDETLKTLQKGIRYQQEGRFKEAEYCYQLVLRGDPDHPDANNLMGMLAVKADALDIAIGYFEKAAKGRPRDPFIRNNLGSAHVQAGDPARAIPHLRKALKARPNMVEAVIGLARAYRQMGRAALARENFAKAARLAPDNPSALIGYGEVLTDLGEMDAAVGVFRDAIGKGVGVVRALEQLRDAHRFTEDDPELGLVEELLAGSGLDDSERISLHHSAGKILSDLGRHDEAFAHFARGKEIAGATFDIARHRSGYDAMMALFTPAFFLERRGFGVDSARPVFIVGMPRSGTTLVEQIIASHPGAHGAGELDDLRRIIQPVLGGANIGEPFFQQIHKLTAEQSRDLAERYLAVLSRHSRSADRVTNKLPHNFELLGVIALLFPNARIVHCRRDPVDTCVSCFTHQFSERHGYNSSLDKLGLYYREYDRLMAHWAKALPMPIFENRYESLIADQEAQTRRLIDFIGLDWDDRCLAFHETERLVQTPSRWQVRQPIYRSSIRSWEKYRAHLGPLFEALGDLAGEADGSD